MHRRARPLRHCQLLRQALIVVWQARISPTVARDRTSQAQHPRNIMARISPARAPLLPSSQVPTFSGWQTQLSVLRRRAISQVRISKRDRMLRRTNGNGIRSRSMTPPQIKLRVKRQPHRNQHTRSHHLRYMRRRIHVLKHTPLRPHKQAYHRHPHTRPQGRRQHLVTSARLRRSRIARKGTSVPTHPTNNNNSKVTSALTHPASLSILFARLRGRRFALRLP